MLCQGTGMASGGCHAGLAKAMIFSLIQLIFERDPEGHSFTLMLGLFNAGLEGQIWEGCKFCTSNPGIFLAAYGLRRANTCDIQQ